MKKKRNSNRKVVVFVSLVATLTLTSALLLVLAPPPLTSDAATPLLAFDGNQQGLFAIKAPLAVNQWKYIYVHHSHSAGGNALTIWQENEGLGDHFVIGNGDGSPDGEIEKGSRWDQQQPPAPPTGASSIDPGCISICLVGDFDQTVPTPAQVKQLTQLVTALQRRLHIPAGRVLMTGQAGSAAGVGQFFPISAFRAQLQP